MIENYLKKRNPNFFEEKLKPLLKYVGTLGAILMTVVYVIIVCVLIYGFKSDLEFKQILVFALTNAFVGLIIMFFLKVQGRDFAKNLEQNKPIIEMYYGTKTKNKPIRSMKYFWITSTLTDILVKGVTVFLCTSLIIKIVIDGSGDLKLLGLAIANIIMFICFGFLSLVKAYDFYNEFHVPFMIEELKKNGKYIEKKAKNDIILVDNHKEDEHNAN